MKMKWDQEYIDQYLKGELPQEASRLFEREMENNPELQQAVAAQRQLIRGVELGFNRNLKSLLRKEESRLQQSEEKPWRRSNNRLWTVAIAACIALVVVAIFAIKVQKATPQALFAQYYQPYPNIKMPISRSASTVEQAPYESYESGKYDKALPAFKALIVKNPADTAAIFYAGIASLELGETHQALQYFDQLDSLGKSRYSRPGVWYEAMAFLKAGEKGKAKAKLTRLQAGGGSYASRASELLNKLQ